jgi:hypothetical protein
MLEVPNVYVFCEGAGVPWLTDQAKCTAPDSFAFAGEGNCPLAAGDPIQQNVGGG